MNQKILNIISSVVIVALTAGIVYLLVNRGSESGIQQPLTNNTNNTKNTQPITPTTTSIIPIPTGQTANWKTYTNTNYNFTLQYPKDPFISGNIKVAQKTGFIPLCDDSDVLQRVACISIASNKYSNTSFEGAVLSVSVIKNVSSESDCDSYVDSSQNGLAKISLNGFTFYRTNVGDGAGGNTMQGNAYRTYHANTCFQLGLGIDKRSNLEFSGLTPLSQQDENSINQTLQQILSTFRFTK